MNNMTAAIVIGCALWCAAEVHDLTTDGLKRLFNFTDTNFSLLRFKLDEYEAYRSAYERDHWFVPERPLNI